MSVEAILEQAAARELLPTSLSSREARELLSSDVRAASLFSARTTNAAYLQKLAEVLDAYMVGRMDLSAATLRLQRELLLLGYTPEAGFPGDENLPPERRIPPAEAGSLRDLGSEARIRLILQTQEELVFGRAQRDAGRDPLQADLFPAWELVRVSPRAKTRDWPRRWIAAGGTLVDGRMIARKDDPFWSVLGSAFDDSLDTDHPPFAYNSGMGWVAIPREEAIALGVIDADYVAPGGAEDPSLDDIFATSADALDEDLLRSLLADIDAELEGAEIRYQSGIARAREDYLRREEALR